MNLDVELLTRLTLYGAVLLLVICIAALVFMSVVVQDTEFIRSHPFAFAFETVVMSLLPAAPLLLLHYTQSVSAAVARHAFWALTFKFALFNVLMHTSGLYRVVMKRDIMSSIRPSV